MATTTVQQSIQLIKYTKNNRAEIISAFGEKGLDAFVGGVGTGGTISGVSHALKKSIQIYKFTQLKPMSPLSCPVKILDHKIQGISAGFIPKHWTLKLMTVLSVLPLIKHLTLDAVSVDKKAFL